MAQVEMTREELDEAIAILHEQKPTARPLNDEFAIDSPEYVWWWWVDGEEWIHANYSSDIASAKRLTDEMVEEGWHANIHIGLHTTRIVHSCVGRITVDVIASTEELARSMAYYEARTGDKVVIKDGS